MPYHQNPGIPRRTVLSGLLGAGAAVAVARSLSSSSSSSAQASAPPDGRAFASLKNNVLTVGNGLFTRSWSVNGPILASISIQDQVRGKQWVAGSPDIQSLARNIERATGASTMSTAYVAVDGVSKTMLQVTLTTPTRAGALIRRFFIPEDLPVIGTQIQTVYKTAAPQRYGRAPFEQMTDIVDAIRIDRSHLSLGWASFTEQTDHTNNLFSENARDLSRSGNVGIRANVWYLEDRTAEAGLLAIKDTMGPAWRFPPNPNDAAVIGNHLYDYGHGSALIGRREWFIVYTPGENARTIAAQRLQLELHPAIPGRDGLAMSNTWGDRAGATAVTESLALAEIAAARRMGLDAVQLDDGWQYGNTHNAQKGPQDSSWGDYWGYSSKFWQANPYRFPRGLGPVADAARRAGVGLGLWYAPSCAHDFSQWRRDVNELVYLIRRFNLVNVKLDGILLTSALGEERLRWLLDNVTRATGRTCTLDLDVTNMRRLGYWGSLAAGPVFVENRYTDSHRIANAPTTYYPHQTFQHLWQLSHYIDPMRLRMEFLDNTRNTAYYRGEQMAPSNYPASTLFAMVMMASPLAWMELSKAPAAYRDDLASILKVWRPVRDEIHASPILPIGSVPDGYTNWAGFVTAPETGNVFAVVIRPRNAGPTWSFTLPRADLSSATVLHGDGMASVSGRSLTVTVTRPQRHLFVRVR